MNLLYLMEHVSRQLHTLVRCYDPQFLKLHEFSARNDFEDSPVYSPKVEAFLFSVAREEQPVLVSFRQEIFYGVTVTPFYYFVAGPVRLSVPVTLNHNRNDAVCPADWRGCVPMTDMGTLIGNLLLLHNLYRSEAVTENQTLLYNYASSHIREDIKTRFSDLVFRNREYGKQHNPYDQEVREFSSIENGDIAQLEKSWEEDYAGAVGILAKDKMRHFKNLGIVVITLASRAAIRGGLLPELAFSLSDSYISGLEECSTQPEVYSLIRQAEYEYTHQVHELLEQKAAGRKQKDQHPRVNQCKDYIFKHLHEKICLSDIASELHLNVNYLSEIFKEYEGISIGNFIQREKINLAKNLLMYSRYSHIEIASYLGFSSQSHLGNQFKKITGITLRQYRNQYGVKEFVESGDSHEIIQGVK